MRLFLAPHNDDEALFGAFTIMREQPLVVIVTDSYVQFERGDGITADERWEETRRACAILGVTPMRMGLPDTRLSLAHLTSKLHQYFGVVPFERVYAPALQGGHPQHDVVHEAARRVFANDRLCYYCTYSSTSRSYANTGARAIIGTDREQARKKAALQQYPSQLARSRHHFEAVLGQPEWLTP